MRKEKNEIERIISEASWVQYHTRLGNDDILKMIRKCHIGVLPTFGDTLGFSVLEMQPLGCPVITTNRMALPEINNEEMGWVIDTQKLNLAHGDDYGRYDITEIELLSKEIHCQLKDSLGRILSAKKAIGEILRKKATIARKNIYSNHNPVDYSIKLKSIYEDGLFAHQ